MRSLAGTAAQLASVLSSSWPSQTVSHPIVPGYSCDPGPPPSSKP